MLTRSIVLVVLPVCTVAFANLTLPTVFSDDAVLQRDRPLPVWGWAAAGETVSVSLGAQKGNATTGPDGRWMVKLPAQLEGGNARVMFDSVSGGLMAARKDGRSPAIEDKSAPLMRFAIAAADKKWVWANAGIDGETVVVSSPEVPSPAAVHHAYSSNPTGANLYNRAGLPALPFRTDDGR